jgi:RNA polymerase sigma-70 factor (ECF subfamily)
VWVGGSVGVSDTADLTQLLAEASAGNRAAMDRLIPIVYNELHAIAAEFIRHERPDHTLQATALVHEVYQKLIDQTRVRWQNRAHFFAVAAQAIRRILVDHARRRAELQHGGGRTRLSLDEGLVAEYERTVDLAALDEALGRLAERVPLQARIVELRFFAGLSVAETAEVLRMSASTVEREWRCARAWLHQVLTDDENTHE